MVYSDKGWLRRWMLGFEKTTRLLGKISAFMIVAQHSLSYWANASLSPQDTGDELRQLLSLPAKWQLQDERSIIMPRNQSAYMSSQSISDSANGRSLADGCWADLSAEYVVTAVEFLVGE